MRNYVRSDVPEKPGNVVWAAPAVLVVAALVVFGTQVRVLEAHTLSWLLRPWFDTFATGHSVIVGADTAVPHALQVTPQCTAAVLVIPCVIAFALFIAVRTVPVGRAVVALASAAALIYVMNQLRMALVAGVWAGLGSNATWATHSVLGTVISLVAVLLGLGLQTTLTAREPARTTGG